MLLARLLDVLLVLVLLVYFVVGWRTGILRTLGGLLGVVAGAAGAFFAIPLIVPLIPEPGWRLTAAIGLALVLILAGQGLGVGLARALRGRDAEDRRVAWPSRLLGGVMGVVIAALASSLVISSLSALGSPLLSQAAAGSVVLRGIDQLTPDPVQQGLSRIRAAVLDSGLPRITEALGGVDSSPGAPTLQGTDALGRASASVVRINGTAYACGQNQSGSGFVVARDRIVTNAHVVAGVAEPVVDTRAGQVVTAKVVYFDPKADLAVLATSGLAATPLKLSDPLDVGAQGAVDGYPYGGPYTSGGAQVLARSTELVADIYNDSRNPREIYTLAAVVEPGNSGGPLLTTDGRVAGVVFAESATDDQLGYASTDASLAPVAAQAPGLTTAVTAGHCTRG
ncbi:MarP family serine protease [Schumannella luteola]|uniref:S1-C subfamily serine protease n=1 Tax=Schumannella luteola TaxID=472059 RepID=A0A852YEN9_9MICO|nr:MarP family serine protease [Schumannella luteola]NYG99770.1 S1-C subfamily serine protease [Schumannella luteola]TPX06545.1 MarP family serine protease [Schumannella luteola]